MRIFFRIFFCLFVFSCTGEKSSNKELSEVKSWLFAKTADFSQQPICADPPTGDYSDILKGTFLFQIDSSKIKQIVKFKKELEPDIISRIDSAYSWVYLAAFLRYNAAVPKLKEKLLQCDKFYGWEGPDYSKLDEYMYDGQYCYQMAYINAIEYITQKSIKQAIILSKEELMALQNRAKFCTEANIGNDSFTGCCAAFWLLKKLEIQ